MNTFKSIMLVGIFFLQSMAAFGYGLQGGMDGGGGNAFVCFESKTTLESVIHHSTAPRMIPSSVLDKITKIETIDLYHAKLRSGVPAITPDIVQISENENLRAYLKKVLARYRHTIPYLEGIVTESIELFRSENIKYRTKTLKPIQDIEDVVYLDGDAVSLKEENCTVATIMVQRKIGGEYFLDIDERLYQHPNHSKLSRVVLWLHEFIYRKARDLGQKNSLTTRLLLERMIVQNDGMTTLRMLEKLLSFGFVSDKNRVHQASYIYWVMEEVKRELDSIFDWNYNLLSSGFSPVNDPNYISADSIEQEANEIFSKVLVSSRNMYKLCPDEDLKLCKHHLYQIADRQEVVLGSGKFEYRDDKVDPVVSKQAIELTKKITRHFEIREEFLQSVLSEKYRKEVREKILAIPYYNNALIKKLDQIVQNYIKGLARVSVEDLQNREWIQSRFLEDLRGEFSYAENALYSFQEIPSVEEIQELED